MVPMCDQLQMTETPHSEIRDSIDGLASEVTLLRETLDELVEIFEWAVQNYQNQVNERSWSRDVDMKASGDRSFSEPETNAVEAERTKPRSPDLLF